MNTVTVVYFESVPHTLSCFWKILTREPNVYYFTAGNSLQQTHYLLLHRWYSLKMTVLWDLWTIGLYHYSNGIMIKYDQNCITPKCNIHIPEVTIFLIEEAALTPALSLIGGTEKFIGFSFIENTSCEFAWIFSGYTLQQWPSVGQKKN